MIYVYIANFGKDEPNELHQRTHDLLSFACENCRFPKPDILIETNGKPIDAKKRLLFSLSHDQAWGAIALKPKENAEEEIGVDIFQNAVSPEKEEKIRARFMADFEEPKPLGEEIQILLCRCEDGKITVGEEIPLADATPSFERDFCLTEAILKAEGGGFTSAKRLFEIEKQTQANAFSLPFGNTLGVATYHPEKEKNEDVQNFDSGR